MTHFVGAKGIAGKIDKATAIAATPFFQKGSEVMKHDKNQFAYFEYKGKATCQKESSKSLPRWKKI